jgi:hypothetical protein
LLVLLQPRTGASQCSWFSAQGKRSCRKRQVRCGSAALLLLLILLLSLLLSLLFSPLLRRALITPSHIPFALLAAPFFEDYLCQLPAGHFSSFAALRCFLAYMAALKQ